MPRRRLQNSTAKAAPTKPVTINVTTNKPKSRQSRRRRGGKNKDLSSKIHSATAIDANAVKMTCGLIDPFCPAARIAKWPDSGGALTAIVSAHGSTSLTTNSNGNAGILFYPGYIGGFCKDETVTTPNVCVFDDPMISPAGIYTSSAVARFRLNSMGIKVRAKNAPLYRSGMLRVRTAGDTGGAGLVSFTATSYAADTYADYAMTGLKDLTIWMKRVNDSSHLWYDPRLINPISGANYFVTDSLGTGWGPIVLYIDGGQNATAQLDIEYVYNYEIQLFDGDSAQFFATPSPSENSMVQEAVSFITEQMGNMLTETGMRIEEMVTDAVKARINGYVLGDRRRLRTR